MAPSSAPETLALALERLVRKEQTEKRLPSVAAAVVRDGEPFWETAVGLADVEEQREATPDTQYRIGSITKTFTAVAIMRLRDAGKLDLDDRLDRHVEGAAHAPTIRGLLSHVSGLQRETHDEAWLSLRFASAQELVETLERAERVLAPGQRFHYSNLAFALLGVVVERVSGTPYDEYVRDEIMRPLGLKRITFEPEEPAARGYLVQPYVEGVVAEAPVATGGWISAGQLWGTVRDLGRWGTFLVDGHEDVLSKTTLEEMRTVQSIADHERWTAAYGLGLGLRRDGERILVGHGGAMPGFIASLLVSPKDKVGAAVLTNSTNAGLERVALKLVAETVEQAPVAPDPWRVEEPPPDDVAALLGRWWIEGSELVISYREGELRARFADSEEWQPPSVFRRENGDLWRTVSGPEHGERLRIERDGDGRVTRLVWAGYPVTREPRPFTAD